MTDLVLAPDDRRGLRTYWLLFLAVNVLTCLPIWIVEYPPLVDYPNHLARMYILYHCDDVPVFHQRYERAIEPLPNLAMEAIAVPLQAVVPVEIAGKIFLTLVLLVFHFGCHFLGLAIHGRPTWMAFAGFFVSCNSMWLYGFVNYCFGVGLFMLTAAAWLRWRQLCKLLPGIGVALLVLLCYLAHMAAFFFVAGVILAVLFVDWLKDHRSWRRLALQALLVLLAVVLSWAGSRGNSGPHVIRWNTLQGKLVASLSLVLSYDYRLDAAIIGALLVILALALWRSRGWTMHRGVLLAALGFLALFVICPVEVLSGSGADARWLPAAVPLLFLAIRFQMPTGLARCALVSFLAVALVRTAFIVSVWMPISQQIAEQVAVLDQLPMGAKIYSAVLQPESAYSKRDRCCMHVVQYATIRRHALTQSLFAYATQQPVRFKVRPPEPLYPGIFDQLSSFDYLWCFDLPANDVAKLYTCCTEVGQGGGGILFRPISFERTSLP